MFTVAAAHMPKHLPANWPGWAIIIVFGFFGLRWLLRVLGIGK